MLRSALFVLAIFCACSLRAQDADPKVETLETALQVVIDSKAAGVPIPDETMSVPIKGLLELVEEGNKKAEAVLVKAGTQEKVQVTRILDGLRKDAPKKRQEVIDRLKERITPKKKEEKKGEKPTEKKDAPAATNAKADAAVAVVLEHLEVLIGYKESGLSLPEEGFVNNISALLDHLEAGSHEAPKAIEKVAKKEKELVLRILAKLKTDASETRKNEIKKLEARINPPKK